MKKRRNVLWLAVFAMLFVVGAFGKNTEAFAASQIAMTESWNWSSLSSSEDRKEYILSVPASGDVTIKLMGYFYGAKMSLYNSDYSKSYYSYVYASGSSSSPITVTRELTLRKGTYRLVVDSGTYDSCGKFGVSVGYEDFKANETEPNDYDHATYLNFDKTVTGALDADDEDDWYRFKVSASGTYVITLKGYFSGPMMNLHNSDLSETFYSYEYAEGKPGSPRTVKKEVVLEKGTYYIKVFPGNSNGGKYMLKVSDPKKISSIKLSASKKTITDGSSFRLKAAVKPSDAYNKKVTWTSSNEKVAGVDSNGRVTAYSTGSVRITATAADGSGVKASCVVYVKPKAVSGLRVTKTSYNAVRLSWYSNSKVNGYRVCVYDKKAKKYKVKKTVKGTTATITGLKASTSYQFGVIPYVKKNNLTGKTASIKTVTAPKSTKITGKKKTGSRTSWYTSYVTMKLSWKKSSGASGYDLLYSSSKNGYYYTWKSGIRSTSCKVERTKGISTYFKVRPYKTYNGTKYYGAASKAVKVTFR